MYSPYYSSQRGFGNGYGGMDPYEFAAHQQELYRKQKAKQEQARQHQMEQLLRERQRQQYEAQVERERQRRLQQAYYDQRQPYFYPQYAQDSWEQQPFSRPSRRTAPVSSFGGSGSQQRSQSAPRHRTSSPPRTRAASLSADASPVVAEAPLPTTPEFKDDMERKMEAASLIQQKWRHSRAVQKRMASLEAVLRDLASLKAAFTFPADPIFNEKGVLTYNSHNAPVHGYVDSLEKLLLRLDGIESEGERKVKQARRDAVHTVEKELASVEEWKAAAFASQSAPVPQEKVGEQSAEDDNLETIEKDPESDLDDVITADEGDDYVLLRR